MTNTEFWLEVAKMRFEAGFEHQGWYALLLWAESNSLASSGNSIASQAGASWKQV